MASEEDPFAALKRKLQEKKLEGQKRRVENLKDLAKNLKARREDGKAKAKPKAKPAVPPAPPAGTKTPPASGELASRASGVEHSPRTGIRRPNDKPTPPRDALPPPKGLVKHHFASEDVKKMSSSKARFDPKTPKGFTPNKVEPKEKERDGKT